MHPDLLAAHIGLLCRGPEDADLFRRQIAHSAFGKIAQRKPAGPDPFQTDHGMSHVVEHAAHLPLPAFVDRDLDPGIGLFLTDLLDLRRCGLPVLQENTGFKRRNRTVLEHSLDLRKIGLGEFMLGMGDQVGKIPVIGQEQKSLSAIIQSPNRINADLQAFEQIQHCRPSFGVGHGRDKAGGLVQHNINQRLFGVDQLAVNLDVVLVCISLSTELGHHLSVHTHPAFSDELFRSAPRRYSCRRYDLLNTF